MGSEVVLVFIPTAGSSHLAPTLEMAKLLVAREPRLSITVLLINLQIPNSRNTTAEPLSSSTASDRIHFVDLPLKPIHKTMQSNLGSFYENHRPHVQAAVAEIASGSPRLAGLVLDMLCASMTDVADEFGIPSYFFMTTNSAFLSLAFHLQDLQDDGREDGSDSDSIVVPSFTNPVPTKIIPALLTDETMARLFDIKRFRKASGILVNTFAELETGAIKALSLWDGKPVPPIYPVGPLISHSPDETPVGFAEADKKAEIVAWLDRQPPSSVVFLCFGSMGSFNGDQVREIAYALERAGVRFLWSLRRPLQEQEGVARIQSGYEDPREVLPEGFVDRTAGVGKVIGWAPQVTVLAHPAVGGFVSHCGWNSTLESIWHGVPVATWPLHAEQQMNAFELVKELGLAVEITVDYRREFSSSSGTVDNIVEADRIEKGIRRLMEDGSEAIRKKVKAMSENSRKALIEGGSSFTSLTHFINKIVDD